MKTLLLLAACTAFAYSHPNTHRLTLADTGKKIDSVIARVHGTFGVAFRDLQTGKTFCRNANEVFHAASTIKTPVMIEVFNQAHSRKFSLDDSLEIVNRFSSLVDGSTYTLNSASDSDDSLYREIGRKEPIRKLVFDMITVSSNLAANLLIQFVGPKNIRHTMAHLGAADIRVLRGVEDTKAYESGRNNTVTAGSLMAMFEQLAKKKVVSREESKKMLDILLQQRFNDMIPGRLPSSVKVAHKTGSSAGIQHDSGIVYLPDGRKYVVVVLSKDLYDARAGIDAIAQISRIIFDYEVH